MADDTNDPITGSCFCGAVRYEATLPSLFCAHCHCRMCQRSNGAAYVTWFAVPRDRFALTGGEAELVRFGSSDHGTRSHCGRCGTPLLCESSHHPDRVDITLASAHEPIDREPQLHAYWSDRAAWTQLEAGLPKLGGKTGMEPVPE